MKLGYFYGRESEQFTFYRIPKLLIKSPEFEKLSDSAKILYGLMLDRMSLSVKNGWFDEENRAYIVFTIENVSTIHNTMLVLVGLIKGADNIVKQMLGL